MSITIFHDAAIPAEAESMPPINIRNAQAENPHEVLQQEMEDLYEVAKYVGRRVSHAWDITLPLKTDVRAVLADGQLQIHLPGEVGPDEEWLPLRTYQPDELDFWLPDRDGTAPQPVNVALLGN